MAQEVLGPNSCENKTTLEEELQWAAFTLPHEYMETLARFGRIAARQPTAGRGPQNRMSTS